MVGGRLFSYWHGNFSGSMLNFGSVSLLNFKAEKIQLFRCLVTKMCKFHHQFLGPSNTSGLGCLGMIYCWLSLIFRAGNIAGNWTLGFKLISGRLLGIAKCPQDKMWKSPQSNKIHGKKRDPRCRVFQKFLWTPWWRIFGHFHWTIAVEGHRLMSRSNDSR